MTKISTVIMDLDNTLYDWVTMWFRSFAAMLEVLLSQSGIERDTLLAEIHKVYRKHGTSEYVYLIEELPSLRNLHPGEDLAKRYGDAIEAYREARKTALCLYPSVKDTLQELKARGCLLVVYTESLAFFTKTRVLELGLDGLIDYLYSPPDHRMRPDKPWSKMRRRSPGQYELKRTEWRKIPQGEHKPNAKTLLDIMEKVGTLVEHTIYVGDSVFKDISMAQDAGITDVHASYGIVQDTDAYALLRQVSHWTPEMIARDKALHESRQVKPSYVLERSFSELLDLFEYFPHEHSSQL